MSDRHPGREMRDQPVVDQRQEGRKRPDGDVPSYDAGIALAGEPGLGGAGDAAQVLLPQRGELRVGAHPAGHFELHAEPAGVLAAQPAHGLDQAVVVDQGGDLVGVLLGQGEEERFLVGEVVEDRSARQAGLLLEELHGRTLVAVGGEGPSRPVEHAATRRLHPLRAHLGHEPTVPNRTSVLQYPSAPLRRWCDHDTPRDSPISGRPTCEVRRRERGRRRVDDSQNLRKGPSLVGGKTGEIDREQEHLTRLYARLDHLRDQTRARIAEIRRRGASGTPQNRSERDAFATMYEDRLAQLNAVESGLCFGRLDMLGGDRHHIGRIGLTDEGHDTLLVDWRAPVAEPFYRATATDALGVVRRRHLRTRGRRLLDVEDDVFDLEALTEDDKATLGGEGALLAALSARRTGRMRDIVEKIQVEQDRIIRAEPSGVLVVQGGPGTGKTAVALHRAAYLLYTHRDLLARTGVLVVGPNSVFLRYIEQVLPSLGETGVVLTTLETLVPGATVTAEDTAEAARIKADAQMADAVADAVAMHERVPDEPMTIPFDEHELVLSPADIAQARSRVRRAGRRHNRGRYAFAKQLLRILVRQVVEIDPELAGKRWVVQSLMRSDEFRDTVNALWPLVSPVDLVESMYAQAEGPLHREPGSGWTAADVPLLDEAWALLGDPNEMVEMAQQRRKQREDVEYAREVIAATGASQTARVDAATLA